MIIASAPYMNLPCRSAGRPMKKLKVVGIAILVVVLLVVAAVAVIFLDLASYTATGSQTLNPSGANVGRALVVYDPGLSGAAQKAAQMIAGDLQAKGYTVNLAGIRSSAASDTSGYAIIVAGGPMYFGRATSSIDGFLKELNQQQEARLGVFAATGNSEVIGSDYQMLQQQVKSDTGNPATITLVLTGHETQNCADLVDNLTV
jgi:menaquinone-dependent protoporphyrinogen IX oxidase